MIEQLLEKESTALAMDLVMISDPLGLVEIVPEYVNMWVRVTVVTSRFVVFIYQRILSLNTEANYVYQAILLYS